MERNIDSLFGSKTRVKLLNLFFNNPNTNYYVREITRLIDEQVNSVRRELSNLQDVGIVVSTNNERKLFYTLNHDFEYYLPLRAIFSDEPMLLKQQNTDNKNSNYWDNKLALVSDYINAFIISGKLVEDSTSEVDMIIVGDNKDKLLKWANSLEESMNKKLNYSIMNTSEFYYRFSAKDIFLNGVLKNKYKVILDKSNILSKE